MFNISGYLEKFRKIGQSEGFFKENVLACLKEVIGIEFDKKNIKIKGGVLFIQANPLIKNQIYIKKTALLDLFSKNLETKNIVDIK